MTLDGDLTLSIQLDGDISLDTVLDGEIGMMQKVIETEYYTGSYEFTPSDEAQTVSIAGLTAAQDITINPVPSNYGLITWNGSVLTVS